MLAPSLSRFVCHLRLAGFEYDAIALSLATGAVDSLVAAGFRGRALDGGLLRVVEAMWEHAGEISAPSPAPISPSFSPLDPPKPCPPAPGLSLVSGHKI